MPFAEKTCSTVGGESASPQFGDGEASRLYVCSAILVFRTNILSFSDSVCRVVNLVVV